MEPGRFGMCMSRYYHGERDEGGCVGQRKGACVVRCVDCGGVVACVIWELAGVSLLLTSKLPEFHERQSARKDGGNMEQQAIALV